ncbi:MAG: Chondroitin synthase [Nitrosomonadaceae bacterium]|nr:Chondroitin synthase [Nitrosomonadaceae bacterium]
MPLISTIIPAYNGASRYLAQALESILAQTCSDLELIVVDDASTDETARVVSCYPQARYVQRATNGGQATARNDGARLAAGTFLAFLDQDDLWKPTFLEETVPILQRHTNVAVIHCDGYQINETGEILEYDGAMKHTRSITQMLRGGHDVATSGSLFRKSSFNAVGGYDDQLFLWEDIDLAIRLFAQYEILHHPHPLYCHRLYARNASRDIPSERALIGRQRFMEKHSASCKPYTPEANALKLDWAQYFGDLGKFHLKMGRTHDARLAFWRAVQHHPLNHKTILRLLRACLPQIGTAKAISQHSAP